MKKIAYLVGAVVLATGSVSAVASFAQPVNETVVSALSSSLLSAAADSEKSARDSGKTADDDIIAAISAVVEGQIEAAVAAGDSSADIQAAMNRAMNTAGISTDVARALGLVNGELATLEQRKPGAFGTGNGGGSGVSGVVTGAPPAGAIGY